ncbi:MAG: uracil-DNA glycosylase [Pseudomonadota bacterium]
MWGSRLVLKDAFQSDVWRAQLSAAMDAPSFDRLNEALKERQQSGAVVFPPAEQIFAAFNLTPFETVKVVILGQDPYHGADQAMGLSFSVPNGVRSPPSLKNIFKEIEADIGSLSLKNGDLTPWARQGVFLLNTSLTVEEGRPGSHAKLGWSPFTDAAVSALSAGRDHLVFMLWGAHAQKKQVLIDSQKHLVLSAAHPSPLSAYRGFFGCGHFSKANSWLEKQGVAPIVW